MNKATKIILTSIILLIFAILVYFFVRGLSQNPNRLDSMAEGRQVAMNSQNTQSIAFQLPELLTGKLLTANDMPEPPYLINIWGTWCPACHVEHPYLLTLAKEIPIIGINWPAQGPEEHDHAINFLNTKGSPYQIVLYDENSQLIVDLGVYGAPETFLVGDNHQILKRYAGPLSPEIWKKEFKPLLNQ